MADEREKGTSAVAPLLLLLLKIVLRHGNVVEVVIGVLFLNMTPGYP